MADATARQQTVSAPSVLESIGRESRGGFELQLKWLENAAFAFEGQAREEAIMASSAAFTILSILMVLRQDARG